MEVVSLCKWQVKHHSFNGRIFNTEEEAQKAIDDYTNSAASVVTGSGTNKKLEPTRIDGNFKSETVKNLNTLQDHFAKIKENVLKSKSTDEELALQILVNEESSDDVNFALKYPEAGSKSEFLHLTEYIVGLEFEDPSGTVKTLYETPNLNEYYQTYFRPHCDDPNFIVKQLQSVFGMNQSQIEEIVNDSNKFEQACKTLFEVEKYQWNTHRVTGMILDVVLGKIYNSNESIKWFFNLTNGWDLNGGVDGFAKLFDLLKNIKIVHGNILKTKKDASGKDVAYYTKEDGWVPSIEVVLNSIGKANLGNFIMNSLKLKRKLFPYQNQDKHVTYFNLAYMLANAVKAGVSQTLRAKADLIVYETDITDSATTDTVYVVDFKNSKHSYAKWDIAKKTAAWALVKFEKRMLETLGVRKNAIKTLLICSNSNLKDNTIKAKLNDSLEIEDIILDGSNIIDVEIEEETKTDVNNDFLYIDAIAEDHIHAINRSDGHLKEKIIAKLLHLFPMKRIKNQLVSLDEFGEEGGLERITMDTELVNFALQNKKRIVKQNNNGYYFVYYDKHTEKASKTYATEDECYKQYWAYMYSRDLISLETFATINEFCTKTLEIKDHDKRMKEFNETTNCLNTETKLALLKYFATPGWRVYNQDDVLDDLLSMRTIIFYNADQKLVDAVTIDTLNRIKLDTPLNLSFNEEGNKDAGVRKTILGKLCSDTEIQNSKSYKQDLLLSAKLGNVLLLRTLFVADEFLKNQDGEWRINDVRVIQKSHHESVTGRVYSATPEVLLYNARALLKEAKSKSTVETTDIDKDLEFVLTLQNFHTGVDYMFDLLKRSSLISAWRKYSKYKEAIYDDLTIDKKSIKNVDDSISHKAKVDFLVEVYKYLTANPEYNSFTRNSGIATENNFDAYIYRQLAFALAEEKNMISKLYDIDIETEWGFKFDVQAGEFLHGTRLNTMDTAKSTIPFHRLFENMRHNARAILTRYFEDAKPHFDKIHATFKNFTTPIYKERFFDLSSPEAILEFKLKNPLDMHNGLTSDEREFLSYIILEFGNWLYKETSEDGYRIRKYNTLKEYKQDHPETWLLVPLKRASTKSRFFNSESSNMKNSIKEGWKQIREGDWLQLDQMDTLNTEDLITDFKDMTEMYDIFALDINSRAEVINTMRSRDEEAAEGESVEFDPFKHFESDLEAILGSLVLSKVKKDLYDKVLPFVSASIACVNFIAAMTNGGVSNAAKESYLTLSKQLTEYVKSTAFSLSLMEKNSLAKLGLVMKQITSTAILGANMKSGIKECISGLFIHYNRALASSMTNFAFRENNHLTLSNLTLAYTTVCVDALLQIGTITLLERLNHIFGISNMDSNDIANTLQYGVGDFRFRYYLYWFNRAPDFLHRMTFIVGYMMQDGCWNAYSVDSNDHLHYNWKKDKRFNLLRNKDNEITHPVEYNKQKALYTSIMDDMVSEGLDIYDEDQQLWRLIKWDGNFDNSENDILPYSYSRKEINSIVQECNITFGYMDHDTKSPFFKKGIGVYVGHFLTFVSAKKIQWFLKPNTYEKGKRVHKKNSDGELLYIDINGNVTTQESFRDATGLILHNKPLIEWEYAMMEGIFWSMIDMVTDFKNARHQEYKVRNILIGLLEIILSLLFWIISRWTRAAARRRQKENRKKILERDPNNNILSPDYDSGFDAGVFALLLLSGLFSSVSGDAFGLIAVSGMFNLDIPALSFTEDIYEDITTLTTTGNVWPLVMNIGALSLLKPYFSLLSQDTIAYNKAMARKEAKELAQ